MTKAKAQRQARETAAAFGFLIPFTLFYTVFTIWPVIQGAIVSFHKWGIMGRQKFSGLANYAKMMKDRFFWESLGNTTKFTIITVPMLIVLAVSLALLANRKSRLQKMYRVCYYMPNVLSVSVVSFLTIYMGSPYMGFVNGLMHTLGAPSSFEPLWLKDPNLVWFTICWITAWWTVGFSMMLYLSALQEISPEIYEAADIDGASKTRQLFNITLPLLKPTTFLVLLLQIIACYKVFGQIYMITKGGPGTITRPLIQYIYETAFTKNDFGYAASMSYALFLILVILSVIQTAVQRRSEA